MDIVRQRMDRFVEDALIAFGDWYLSDEAKTWLGKEHDCVNRFAFELLAGRIDADAAIKERGQIRIEGAVPQPEGFTNASARKDIVIWGDALATAWSPGWLPTNYPRVVMEWKTKRTGRPREEFDAHDLAWVTAFTNHESRPIGYLVQLHAPEDSDRIFDWAKVVEGKVRDKNLRS